MISFPKKTAGPSARTLERIARRQTQIRALWSPCERKQRALEAEAALKALWVIVRQDAAV